jgi:CxxC motif-containing protein (DUF1111 family)
MMRPPVQRRQFAIGLLGPLGIFVTIGFASGRVARAYEGIPAPKPDAEEARKLASGRELFARQWVPDDRRSHGGDGLGPVYNERSCAGCHHQAGPGGGGSSDKNIEIITPLSRSSEGLYTPAFAYAFSFSYGMDGFEYRIGNPAQSVNRARRPSGQSLAELVRIHPGFRDTPSVVLHRYGNDADYRVWREWVLDRRGSVAFRSSQRNPTPLFGTGSIDSIPEAVIEAASQRKHPLWPRVTGRVSRIGDGRIGRFGWKAQTASLREFILSAAAVELGLEVPGHAQAADPRVPPLKAPGLDMNAQECDSLLAYVGSLPAPAARAPANPRDERAVKNGKALFKSTGCAECHVPKLGEVANIYSDLLLHAMGAELGDTPAYGAFVAGAEAQRAIAARGGAGRRADAATDQEWRTPPLWGLRNSAPYLHDGRASSIEEAILLHGGEGLASAQRYRQLPPRDQAQLQNFLLSLAGPRGAGADAGR